VKAPVPNILHKYWQAKIIEHLTATADFYKVEAPDTRPWWRKKLSMLYRRLHWLTIGRFRAWLHRDCGDW
jgi:hypothetical protein